MHQSLFRRLLPVAMLLALVLAFGQLSGYLIWGNPSWHRGVQVAAMHLFAAAVRMLGMAWIASRLGSRPQRTGTKAELWVYCCMLAWGLAVDAIATYHWMVVTESYVFRLIWFSFCTNGIYAAVMMGIAVHALRARQAAADLERTELEYRGQGRELDDARLQLLQAQAEPHFLFNALANVRHLLRTEGVAAKALLSDLLQYLQVALPALREAHTTLACEADLVRSYLAIHQVRMGGRLASQVEVPEELSAAKIPSLALLTLVENAIKHGVGPLVAGGSITVRAERNGDALRLTVCDTGKGMGSSSGGGTGLANLRLRLKAMFGADARLSLALNEPCGMLARIEVPLRTDPA